MDSGYLLLTCVIFLLDQVTLSKRTTCDEMKVYNNIQKCSTKYNVPVGQPADVNNLAEFCKTLEAARLCTKMALEKCDDEDVKITVSFQLQHYDTLTKSFCSDGVCTDSKLQECLQKIKQPAEKGMKEYCRSIKEVKDCLTEIVRECEDKRMRKLVQDTIKDIRQQKENCHHSSQTTMSNLTTVLSASAVTTTPSNGVMVPSQPAYVAVITLYILYSGLCFVL